MRHWKQRFNPADKFKWRRPVLYDGVLAVAGTPVPPSLQNNRAKLKRFWNGGFIELADFDVPDVTTGDLPPAKTLSDEALLAKITKKAERRWVAQSLKEVFPSRRAALEALKEHEAAAVLAEAF